MTDDGADTGTPGGPVGLAQIVDRSLALYRLNLGEFVAMAAVTLPVDVLNALVSAAIEDVVVWTLVSAPLSLLSLLVTVAATVALARAVDDVGAGRRPDFNRSYRYVGKRAGVVLLAALRVFVPVFLAALTVVGIPLAVFLAVRWAFFPQAIAIDGLAAGEAVAMSARIVKGQWWRTFGILLVVSLLASLPAVAVTILFAPAAAVASGLANAVAAVIVLPFMVAALTLLYFDLRSRERQRVGTA